MKRARLPQERFLTLEALESRVLLSTAPIVPPTVTNVTLGIKADVVVQKKGDVASVTLTSDTGDSGKVLYYWAIQTPGSNDFMRIGTRDGTATMRNGSVTLTGYKGLSTATVGSSSAEVVIDSGVGAGLVSNVVNFSVIPPSPTPNPSTWDTLPVAVDNSSITMTATLATDDPAAGALLYDFVCGTKGGHTSGWQTSPTYVDSGLNAATWYSYKVITEDSFGHAGKYSVTAKALTLPITVSDVSFVLNTTSVIQNKTAPIASGNATGTGTGPFTYEWDVEMPGGTFKRVGSVHTAKMVNGVATVPPASLLKSCLGNCNVQLVIDSGASKGFISSASSYTVMSADTSKVTDVTGVTINITPDPTYANGSLVFGQGEIITASGTINGTGSGPVSYVWECGIIPNGSTSSLITQQVSGTLTTAMVNGVATVPTFTGLPSNLKGSCTVLLKIVSMPYAPEYGTGTGTYDVVTPFVITGVSVNVSDGTHINQYAPDEAFGAITSCTGAGTYTYVWLIQGPNDSSPHQVGGVYTTDVEPSLGTLGYQLPEFDLPTDTLGTVTVWVEILSPGAPLLSDPVSYTVLEPPPEVLFTPVPTFANPTMDIAGRVVDVDPTQYQGVAVYIYSPQIGGWTGPQPSGSVYKINADGTWSGTIDTSALTSGSNMEIGAFLIPNGATVPQLNGSDLTDALVSDLYAFIQIATSKS